MASFILVSSEGGKQPPSGGLLSKQRSSASNALRSYTFVLQLSRNLGSFSARQGLWPTVRVQSSPVENNVWRT